MPADPSNGYDGVTDAYIEARSGTGVAVVRAWSSALPRGGSVLDLGCGHGMPLAGALAADGFEVFGVDASPRMVRAFEERLPGAAVACEPVEESRFFDRRFDGVLAVGLVFLLPEDAQQAVLARMAGALKPSGRLLVSAPREVCAWEDVLTGRPSRSLGEEAYGRVLSEAGLVLAGTRTDEGGNHYYEALGPSA